jgi:hypothetical protein
MMKRWQKKYERIEKDWKINGFCFAKSITSLHLGMNIMQYQHTIPALLSIASVAHSQLASHNTLLQ